MSSFFDASYRGTPPWDVGHPQTEFVKLADEGKIRGEVLDVGCGTGESAILFAGMGLDSWGLDSSPLAIEKAKRKASERSSKAHFVVGDALRLHELHQKFDTITDSGLFHVFPDEERVLFARSLHSVLKKGGKYYMLCFSDKEPEGWGGPRRVSEKEIRATFRDGWEVEWIREAKFDTNLHRDGGLAWFSSVTRA